MEALQCRILNVSFDNKSYSFLFLKVKMKDFDVSLEWGFLLVYCLQWKEKRIQINQHSYLGDVNCKLLLHMPPGICIKKSICQSEVRCLRKCM